VLYLISEEGRKKCTARVLYRFDLARALRFEKRKIREGRGVNMGYREWLTQPSSLFTGIIK